MRSGRMRALQVALSGVAGFVDAIGYLSLGGFYVALMSGNSTMLGIAAGISSPIQWQVAGGLVAAFLLGVVLGTLLGGLMQRLRPVGVLLLVAALLATAAGLDQRGHLLSGALVMATAMGAENTVFNRPGHSGVGLTYMTGTLVRIGQRLSEALSGGSWLAVLPDALLWLGMVAGAGLGALAFHGLAVGSLWIAVGATLLIAAVARMAVPGKASQTAAA